MENSRIPAHDAAMELVIRIGEERLHQAHHSFILSLVMTAASATISFVGVGLLLSGQAPEGTVTAAVGLASSVRCLKLAQDSNDRLDKMAEELMIGNGILHEPPRLDAPKDN